MRRPLTCAVVAVLALTVAAGCSSDDEATTAEDAAATGTSSTVVAPEAVRSEVLLDAVGETILGQPLTYPGGTPEVSSSLITLAPGASTGWHHHEVPLYGYIVSGELTVDYGDEGERTYPAGTAFLEAIGTSHDGRNDGDEPVVILAVYLGAPGVENAVEDPTP